MLWGDDLPRVWNMLGGCLGERILNLVWINSAKEREIYRNVYYRIWRALKFRHGMFFILYRHFVRCIFRWHVGIVAHFALRLPSMIETIGSKTMWISFISAVSGWDCSTDNHLSCAQTFWFLFDWSKKAQPHFAKNCFSPIKRHVGINCLQGVPEFSLYRVVGLTWKCPENIEIDYFQCQFPRLIPFNA